MQDIRISGGVALMAVETAPRAAEVTQLQVTDDGDGLLFSGEEVAVTPSVINSGGLELWDATVRLRSDDPHLEILSDQVSLGRLHIGEEASASIDSGRLAFRFTDGFVGMRESRLFLDLSADGEEVGLHEYSVTGYSPRQVVQSIAVIDSAGNGDGLVQAGEFIRLGLELQPPDALLDSLELWQFRRALRTLDFSLRPASKDASLIGNTRLDLDADAYRVWSTTTPEFLLAADLQPGSRLPFELRVGSPHSQWADTLTVGVSEGGDETAPRVLSLWTRPAAEGVALSLLESNVVEGGAVADVRVRVYRREDTVQVASVALERKGDQYEGMWRHSGAGQFLARAEVTDNAGNTGWGRLQGLFAAAATTPGSHPVHWELLELPGSVPAHLSRVAVARGDAHVLYGVGPHAIWLSRDRGGSWARTGYMVGHMDFPEVHVDAVDPFTVYVGNLISRDGGSNWQPVAAPGEGVSVLSSDPVCAGKLYGYRSEGGVRLMISEDWGGTWRETPVEDLGVMVNPADANEIYAGYPGGWGWVSTTDPGRFWHSVDGGMTWEAHDSPRFLEAWAVDPHTPGRLYGCRGDTVFHSLDRGTSWDVLSVLEGRAFRPRPHVHPALPGFVVVGDYMYHFPGTAWRSWDAGKTWEELEFPQDWIREVVLDPHDGHTLYAAGPQRGLRVSRDGGSRWEAISPPTTGPSAGTIEVGPGGQMYIGSGSLGEDGKALPLTFIGRGHGEWERRGREGFEYPWSSLRVIESLFIDPHDSRFLLAESGGVIMRSENGGEAWQRWPDGWSRCLDVQPDPLHVGTYYMATDELWRSEDFGATWQQVSELSSGKDPPFSSGRTTRGLELDPGDPSVMYVAMESAVWRSGDGGSTWDREYGEVDGTILRMHRHPSIPGVMYAVTVDGFHRSDDMGRTWARLALFQPSVSFEPRLRFHPKAPGAMYLVAGTRLLETRDGGSTWAQIDIGLSPRIYYNDVAVDPADPGVLNVATPWGLYRMSLGSVTAVEESRGNLPATCELHQNYPNPFNANTVIRFSIPVAGKASLTIHNLIGQVIRKLADENLDAGLYSTRWDGEDDAGRRVSSGVYLYRLQTAQRAMTRKLVLVK